MRILLKYFIWLLSLVCLVIYYLLGSTLGHKNVGYFVEDYYSKKLDNKIEVLFLDVGNYPFIIAELKINDTAVLSLKGDADRDNMDMAYHLRGENFKWNSHNILQAIDLKGRMNGKLSELEVKGEGEIFEGKTSYSFVRRGSRFEALDISLNDIASGDFLRFLKYDFEIEGVADVFLNFDYFSDFRKKGVAKIRMKKAMLPKVSGEVNFSLEAEIAYKDLLRNFFLDIHSDIGKLRVANGYYNKSAALMEAEYGLHINELAYFEKFLRHKYHGELNTAGKFKYESGEVILVGDSTSYGGLLEYNYKNNYLDILFKGVALEKLLRQLSFPALLSSKIYGTASYDIEDEIILVNTKLKETRFRRTKMTDKIYEFTDIDIRKDIYNNSIFTAAYEDNILTSFLQIDNGVNHLYLRNTKMNSQTNAITADFEISIDEQEFLGEVYGTLKDPKVNLDMTRLIKYQINKKIDNFFGREKPLNKENTKEKLYEIKENLNNKVQQKTRTFLEGFFD